MKLLFFKPSLKTLLSFIIIWFISAQAYSQIQIEIQNAPHQLYYLQQIKGDRITTLDSLMIEDNTLLFNWKDSYLRGMYRLFDGERELLFVADYQPVVLATVYPELQEHLLIKKSLSNQLWFSYLKAKERSYRNLDLLNPIINWYDKESAFYRLALEEFENQQDLLPALIQENKSQYPSAWIHSFIDADIKPNLPLGLSLEEQGDFFKRHWFDQVDWYDNDLMNANILTNKITEYLGLYADRNMDKAQLQMAFKYAVDQVIPLTQDNDEMYAFVMDYLVRGFERFNFEEVILHIALNYPPPVERCENEGRKSEALARLEKYESMQIGQIAMDFKLPGLEGDTIQLSQTDRDKILIVFWASWCPHCQKLIPQLQDWYTEAKQKEWQIYAISIDTDKQELDDFMQANRIKIPVLCDFKGWDTQTAIDYNIYATPTMIVLDKDLKILAKPVRISELE